MFNRKSIAPIIQQTRDLHEYASKALALQEGLRMHQAAFRRFNRGLTKTLLAYPTDGLGTRMDYVSELLDFYETTCDTIIQQQKNLLSLVSLILYYLVLFINAELVGLQPRDGDAESGSSAAQHTCGRFPSDFLRCGKLSHSLLV